MGDHAVEIALGRDFVPVGVGEDDRTGEVSAALFIRHVPEILEELSIVGLVVPVYAAVAGRVDPRRAAERIHAQPAVVGKGAAAGDLRDLPRLLGGVLEEGLPVLDGLMLDPRLAQGQDLVKHVAQDRLDLDELVGVVGGNNQFHKQHLPAVLLSCAYYIRNREMMQEP